MSVDGVLGVPGNVLELDTGVRRGRSIQCLFKKHQVVLTQLVNAVDEGFNLKGPGVTADAEIGEPNFV